MEIIDLTTPYAFKNFKWLPNAMWNTHYLKFILQANDSTNTVANSSSSYTAVKSVRTTVTKQQPKHKNFIMTHVLF